MFFYPYVPPNKFQVQMIHKTSGFVVNASSIFTKEEDLRWYLYLTANLMEHFRFIVLYQTFVSTGVYDYQYYQGCYEYLLENDNNYPNTNDEKEGQSNEPDYSANTSPDSATDNYEVPPRCEFNDNTLPTYTEPASSVANNFNDEIINSARRETTTSGFNFHFDPPTNLNFQIQTENANATDQVEWQENTPQDSSFMVYPENNVYHSIDDNNLTQVLQPEVSQFLQEIELEEDDTHNPQLGVENQTESDISELEEAPLGTSTPPPVDDDYWNVVDEENYEDMKLQKYGRGYILKCDSDHPDYGIKYFPNEENCRAWWQPSNDGWFVRRENKNYFLERGAQFEYRNSKRVRY